MAGKDKWFPTSETGARIMDPLVAEYLEWFVDPDRGTHQSWCDAHGVSRNVTKAWERNYVFQSALRERLAELNVSPDRVQEVVNRMHREAVGGNVKAMELYLRYTESIQPEKVVIETRNVSELTDAELAALLTQVD